MSSSERKANVHALPWALDEFTVPDIFPVSEPVECAELPQPTEERDLEFEAQERERIEAQAYARGVADGEQIARSDYEQRVASLLATLSEAVESIRVHEARWIANAEENVAAIAVGVARHLVQREITAEKEAVQALVQRAISKFPLDQPVTVRLHPDDHAVCSQLSDGRTHEVVWMPDVHIDRGGCLVEGRERIIDGRVDTALERLYRTIGQVQ